jgi:hypothetical protein
VEPPHPQPDPFLAAPAGSATVSDLLPPGGCLRSPTRPIGCNHRQAVPWPKTGCRGRLKHGHRGGHEPGMVTCVRMSFEVGVTERHEVVFSFNKFWGSLSITVDDTNVVRTIRLASIELVRRYEFVVGANERHHVRIEKHRQRLFAGFRPQPVYAYVDGQLVAQGVA